MGLEPKPSLAGWVARLGGRMVGSEYFRRQAQVCLRLAATFIDQKGAATLVGMAEDFMAKADLIDQAEQSQRSIGQTTGSAPG